MTRPRTMLTAWYLAGALLGAAATAAAQSTFVNEEVGYRIRVPDDFEQGSAVGFTTLAEILSQLDGHVIDRFSCRVPLQVKSGGSYNERMTTYYFPKRSAADVARAGGSELYLSFRDYAQAKIRGFYFASEEEFKVAGLPAKVSEMVFEKLAGIPRRYYVCAYEIPSGEFAVVFTCTDEHFKKRRSDYQKSFKSFKMASDEGLKTPKHLELKAPAPEKKPGTDDAPKPSIDLQDPDAAAAAVEEVLQRVIATTEEERRWRTLEGDHFLVVYGTGQNFAKKLSKHTESLAGWLEEHYGTLGNGKPRRAIVVAREIGEEVIDLGKIPPYVAVYHVAEVDDPDPRTQFNRLNDAYIAAWFHQKNPALWKRMPRWIRTGLPEVLDNAYLKGSRLSFDMHDGERNGLAWLSDRYDKYRDDGEQGVAPLAPCQDLIGPASTDLFANSGYAPRQANALVRFLFDGPGSRAKLTESLIDNYLAHCRNLAADFEEEENKRSERLKELEDAKDTMTDEERLKAEDELYRLKRELSGTQAERDMLEQCFQRTFGEWTESDWSTLDRGLRSFLKRVD